jgi:hypothetical protein
LSEKEEVKEEVVGYRNVHLRIREDLYKRLWEICKKRYVVPVRKFYIVVNEAIEEYLKTHGG